MLGVTPLPLLLALPWVNGLASWTLPAALGAGLALGALLTLATGATNTTRLRFFRWLRVNLSPLPFLLVAALVGAGLILLGERNSQISLVGPLLLGVYAATVNAALPWLLFRARLVWLALAMTWLLAAGAWNFLPASAQSQRLWWAIWLLLLSLLTLGAVHLRGEILTWRALSLQRVGPVARQVFGAIALSAAAISLLAFAPVELARSAVLSNLWNRQPLAHQPGLPYRGASGTPIETLGAPLPLTAQSVSGSQILYAYTLLSGIPQQTPLLGETFDSFDGHTWTLAPVTDTHITNGMSDAITFPRDAQLLSARITVATMPDVNAPPLLVSFSQPIAFSVTAQARTLSGGAPGPLTVADWRTASPLAKGTTYKTYSAVLPDDIKPQGTLPADLRARMTVVPSSLAPLLRTTADAWLEQASNGAATASLTPQQEADFLLQALHAHVTLDPKAIPPTGAEPIRWGLNGGRANGLLYTTLYVLLGRALGVPLRIAEGYLPGHYDATLHQLVVRASDGTVWAQLAIPGEGWQDILTVAKTQLVIVPRSPQGAPTPSPSPTPNSQGHRSGSSLFTEFGSAAGVVGLGALGLLVLLLALALGLAALRWSRIGQRLEPLGRTLARVGALARVGGVPLLASDTASEGAAKVAAVLSPPQVQALTDLNHDYERHTYGPANPASSGLMGAALARWRRLRSALLGLILSRFFRRQPPKRQPSRAKGARQRNA
jgi:transglutaminase-like putative cysteine protease